MTLTTPSPTTVACDPHAVAWFNGGPDTLTGRRLLVAMHGYDADETTLQPILDVLETDAVIAFLRAPHTTPHGKWAWFPIQVQGEIVKEVIAQRSATAVLTWLEDLPSRPDSVDLLGFSQGGAMVTELFRTSPAAFRKGVVLSGFSVTGERPADRLLARMKPPFYWGYDPHEHTITQGAMFRTSEWLPKHTTLTTRTFDGMGHSVWPEELEEAAAFLSAD